MIYKAQILLSFELNGKRSLQMLCSVHETIYEEKHQFEKANMLFVKAL